MTTGSEPLPEDIATLQALLVAERAARLNAEAEAKARALEVEQLKFTIAKLRHERYGQSAERGALLEQLELRLADLEEDAEAAATTAEAAAAQVEASPQVAVRGFTRQKPARRPLPDHLPRERIVYPAPQSCPCCGGVLRKIGEDVTEMLEHVPARWKVIQHVREKFSCRACEAIAQPPAPSHPIARGRAGPQLLAQVLFSKYGAHLPLTRQSAIYAREGVELEVSTLADWVGAAAATLMPLVEAIRSHVFAAQRIHADDTTVPVLAPGKTRTGRLWTYVRDDRPFGEPDPPAAAFFYSRDRGGEHPGRHLAGYAGLMQADAYAGFNRLYEANRRPGPIVEAACWAHYLERGFIWSGRLVPTFPPMTPEHGTPHNTRGGVEIRRREGGDIADPAANAIECRCVHRQSGVAQCPAPRLPSSSVGRLFVCPPRQLCARNTARIAHCAVVLSRGPSNVQLAAGLSCGATAGIACFHRAHHRRSAVGQDNGGRGGHASRYRCDPAQRPAVAAPSPPSRSGRARHRVACIAADAALRSRLVPGSFQPRARAVSASLLAVAAATR